MGYTKKTIKGLSWMSGFRATTRLFAFVKIAILARVLSPVQFGVFGIVSLVLAFLETLTETGINIIIVQSKKHISEYVNSAWVVSILRGISIALMIILLSPLIASFFHSPDSLSLLPLISIVPLIRGFINPSIALYQKELRFHSEFWFKTSILIFDTLVSVSIALLTFSVYSLVWGMIAGALLEVILSFVFLNPKPRFVIERKYFNEIFHKGKWVTIYSFLNYLAGNIDSLVVGRIMSASSLGIYQMAYKVAILPISEISEVVSRVVFPVYTKIADDTKRLFIAFLKTTMSVFIISLIIGLCIFLFPSQIITILLGEKWLAATVVLKVLAIYGVIRTLSGPTSGLFLSVGKQNYVMYMTFIRFTTLAIAIYPMISIYGLIGAGYAALLSAIVEIPVMIYFSIQVLSKK